MISVLQHLNFGGFMFGVLEPQLDTLSARSELAHSQSVQATLICQ